MRRSVRGRDTSQSVEDVITLGSYKFDSVNFKLTNHQSKRNLTAREAEILRLLFIHRDRVLKREEILNTVWGDDDYFAGRSMDVYITKIRKYLKDDTDIEIQNVHGVGFKLMVKE